MIIIKLIKLTEEKISQPLDLKGKEISSQIIDSEHQFEVYFKIIKKMEKELGYAEWKMGGGFHVHYGVPELTTSELDIVFYLTSKLDSQIRDYFDVDRSRSHIGPISKKVLNYTYQLKAKKLVPDEEQDSYLQKEQLVRYNSKFKTLEFRIENSTFDEIKIRQMMIFVDKFVSAVREKNPELMKFVKKTIFRLKLKDFLRIINYTHTIK